MASATEPSPRRRRLPILERPGRSPVTCFYRCGNACSHPVPNRSENEYFGDVLAAAVSRRAVLKTGAITAAVVAANGLLDRPAAAAPAGRPGAALIEAAGGGTLTFGPVPPNRLDAVLVPNGYEDAVVIRWGDPVEAGAGAFDPARQSAARQAKAFGYNCDYVTLLPLGMQGGRRHGLLVVNHEYTDEQLMFAGWTGYPDATDSQIEIAMMAHGISVVEVQRGPHSGRYFRLDPSQAPRNRRIHVRTPFRFTGPAAGTPLLRTSRDPRGRTVLGSLNNCAGGTTPWGTVLSGEENFDQYFVNGIAAPPGQRAALDRYGFDTAEPTDPESNRGWHRVDARFDIGVEPHEPNRFGWIIELDPRDPHSTPAKRTALGRMKHEAATIALTSDDRPVAYMGDDERFEYVYKFVSNRQMDRGQGARARRHNDTLLDDGTLYAARFTGDTEGQVDGDGHLPSDGEFDGLGEWIPLVTGARSHIAGMSAAEVLIHTRLAADRVGATKMDRPEDIERNPVNGRIYAAMTNNSERTGGHLSASNPTGVDEANPRAVSLVAGDDGTLVSDVGNRNGHIIEITEAAGNPAARRFRWRIFLLAGSPEDPSTYFAGYDKSQVSPISCPDNLAFDPLGNLWIATDGNRLGSNDGFFAVPVDGPHRGHLKQFLTVPIGAEACGPWITADSETLFCAVQHPGELDESTYEHPASHWPDGGVPRPSVINVWRTAPGEKRIGL